MKRYLSILKFYRRQNRVRRSIRFHSSVDRLAAPWESVPLLQARKCCSFCLISATREIASVTLRMNIRANALTEWNLNTISGRTRSKKCVIFFPTRSGNITINEFPILLTIMSDLETINGSPCCVEKLTLRPRIHRTNRRQMKLDYISNA